MLHSIKNVNVSSNYFTYKYLSEFASTKLRPKLHNFLQLAICVFISCLFIMLLSFFSVIERAMILLQSASNCCSCSVQKLFTCCVLLGTLFSILNYPYYNNQLIFAYICNFLHEEKILPRCYFLPTRALDNMKQHSNCVKHFKIFHYSNPKIKPM